MQIYTAALCWASFVSLAAAFLPSSTNLQQRSPYSSVRVLRHNDLRTNLKMAFDNSEPSNMFEGPRPLVKERDACGVGFVVNTKTGGR